MAVAGLSLGEFSALVFRRASGVVTCASQVAWQLVYDNGAASHVLALKDEAEVWLCCCSGAISFEDGVRLVKARAEAMQVHSREGCGFHLTCRCLQPTYWCQQHKSFVSAPRDTA